MSTVSPVLRYYDVRPSRDSFTVIRIKSYFQQADPSRRAFLKRVTVAGAVTLLSVPTSCLLAQAIDSPEERLRRKRSKMMRSRRLREKPTAAHQVVPERRDDDPDA